MKLAFLIAAACPTGSNIAMYAQLYDQDYLYAVETVVISTLLCIISMPAIVMLARCSGVNDMKGRQRHPFFIQ
ncbi:MAG: hypothetical protein IKD69_05240 [Solobacterium sp.]|nr:hypothetical protein [Solobacterium sp.]